eukprot:757507-Hanusia_phi.AAC.1
MVEIHPAVLDCVRHDLHSVLEVVVLEDDDQADQPIHRVHDRLLRLQRVKPLQLLGVVGRGEGRRAAVGLVHVDTAEAEAVGEENGVDKVEVVPDVRAPGEKCFPPCEGVGVGQDVAEVEADEEDEEKLEEDEKFALHSSVGLRIHAQH